MNVVLPMAGRGSRLAGSAYAVPKPLIPIAGRPMVAWALESIKGIPHSRLIVVALAEHERRFALSGVLTSLLDKEPRFVWLDDVAPGQLCSVLAAQDEIEPNTDLLVISADTYVRSDLGEHIAERDSDCHGIISTARMPGTRWSFARTDDRGHVVEVAEKVRISDHASTGLYYFSSAREFLDVAHAIVAAGETTRGEYYVIPVYQKYIERGWKVAISEASEMWDMGTPDALERFARDVTGHA